MVILCGAVHVTVTAVSHGIRALAPGLTSGEQHTLTVEHAIREAVNLIMYMRGI